MGTHNVPDHRTARDHFVPADPGGRPNPGITAHPGIALVRIDARLGRLTCEGSPNNTNAAINNAENIDWSPAFVGPPGERVLKLSA